MHQAFRSGPLFTILTLAFLFVACDGKNAINTADTTGASGDSSTDQFAGIENSDCSPIGIIDSGRTNHLKGCFLAGDTLVYFSTERRDTPDALSCTAGSTVPGTVTARYWIEGGNEVEITLEDECIHKDSESVRNPEGDPLVEPSPFPATHEVTVRFNDRTVGSLLPQDDIPWPVLKALFKSPIGQAMQMVPLELALEETSQESPGELAALVSPWQFGLRHITQLELPQARITAEAASGNFFAPDLFPDGTINRPWWRRPTDLIFSEALPFPHVFGYLPFDAPLYEVPPQAFRSPDGTSFAVGSADLCNESLDACAGACGQGCYSDSCVSEIKCPSKSPLLSQGNAVIEWTCTTNTTCQTLDTGFDQCAKNYSQCDSWGRSACFVEQEKLCLLKNPRSECIEAIFGGPIDLQVPNTTNAVYYQTQADTSTDLNDSDPSNDNPDAIAGLDTYKECLNDDDDEDGDQLPNAKEIIAGTDPFNPDTDGDLVDDGVDACPLDPGDWPTGCPQQAAATMCEDACENNSGENQLLCAEDALCDCAQDSGNMETPCVGPEQQCIDDPDLGASCVSLSACAQLCEESGQQDSCLDQFELCTCTGTYNIEPYDCTQEGPLTECVPSDNGGEAICGATPGITSLGSCPYQCADDPICDVQEGNTFLCLCEDNDKLKAIDCGASSFTDVCSNGACVPTVTSGPTNDSEFSQKCFEICSLAPDGGPNCNYEDANQLCLCDGSGTAQNCDFENPGWVCNGTNCGPPGPVPDPADAN